MSTQDIIEKQLADNAVILYMKGVPTAPECGFSAKAVGILNAIKVPFAYVVHQIVNKRDFICV
jgi:monothiol glutaredoxin